MKNGQGKISPQKFYGFRRHIMIKKIWATIKALWKKLNDPTRSLQRHHNRLLLEARELQRRGDIPAFAKKTREAADLEKRIEELTKK